MAAHAATKAAHAAAKAAHAGAVGTLLVPLSWQHENLGARRATTCASAAAA